MGVAIAYFVRWRGGFSRAADEVVQRLPDAVKPEATPEPPPADAGLAGDPDDARLADRVRTEVYGDERFNKGNVNVTAEYGRIVLHGEVEQRELIDELVGRVRAIEGVRHVESRLHVGGEQITVELPERPED